MYYLTNYIFLSFWINYRFPNDTQTFKSFSDQRMLWIQIVISETLILKVFWSVLLFEFDAARVCESWLWRKRCQISRLCQSRIQCSWRIKGIVQVETCKTFSEVFGKKEAAATVANFITHHMLKCKKQDSETVF